MKKASSNAEILAPGKQELLLDLELIKKGAAISRAVNHSLRQRMLQTIHKKGIITVTELKTSLGLSQSITSIHLKILRDAKVVLTQRDGAHIFYSLNYQKLKELQRLYSQLIQDQKSSF